VQSFRKNDKLVSAWRDKYSHVSQYFSFWQWKWSDRSVLKISKQTSHNKTECGAELH
jgi:hypothetical protein